MKRRASKEAINENETIQISAKIGAGAYGSVYESKISCTSELMATKMLLSEKHYDYDMPSHIRDILIGGSGDGLRRGVIKINAGENAYATISTCGICTLETLAPNQIPYFAARIIFFDLLNKLHKIHDMGIMHRDLKPANIILTSNKWPPTFEIIDFGISTVQQSSCEESVMSLWWRPPEVLYLFDHTNKSDVWSLAIIILGLVCSEKFMQCNNAEEAKKIIWTKLGYPGVEEWPELHSVNGSQKFPTPQGIHLIYSSFSTILSEALLPNPILRSSCETLLKHDFFNVATTENEIQVAKEWFEASMVQIANNKNSSSGVKLITQYTEGQNMQFCTKFDSCSTESDALYVKNALTGLTVTHVSLMKKVSKEFYFDNKHYELAVLIMDRVLSASSSFPPLNAACLVSAVSYITSAIAGDSFIPLKTLARSTHASSRDDVKNSVHFVLCALKCKLIPNHIKKFVMATKRWEWFMTIE
jgi:serine/threonine protein kinase